MCPVAERRDGNGRSKKVALNAWKRQIGVKGGRKKKSEATKERLRQ